jgi:hypothetical protein
MPGRYFLITPIALALFVAASPTGAASSHGFKAESTSSLCVGAKPGCFATLQAAIDAAQAGDTIELGPGIYAGGVTIDKSVNIVGVAAAATTISGGGPVLTIGTSGGQSGPVVSIGRVTITGGENDSQPSSDVAKGGGVAIVSASAVVTISDSVISGNRVIPSTAGFALGGGIDNAGTLTLTSTRVTDNDVGSTASSPSVAVNARAGGINNEPEATLTLQRSAVTRNHVAVTASGTQLAVAGGISDFGGALTIEDSVVSDNTVDASTASLGELDSFTGGIEITGDARATITRAVVSGNSVHGTNTAGDVLAGAGGISTDPDVTVVLRNSAVDGNTVSIDVAAPGAGATAFAGGFEVEGDVQVSDSHFIGNRVHAATAAGATIAVGGGLETRGLETVALSDSLVADNSVEALTLDGFAASAGGGIFNGGLLAVHQTRVVNNYATATGPAGLAQGGGIWNGLIPGPGNPQSVQLTLVDSAVLGNRLDASPGLDRLGGGVFASEPVSLVKAVIAGNKPDQCYGC